ncbi:MAG: ribonuclease P [Candidatus Thorarchaeota archaeon]|nr:ribonuclease P [Candidatus Thorarchaeota archaeon]
MSKRKFAKEKIHRLAQARIGILWRQALQEAKIRPEIARKQMLSARKIAQRARIKIPREVNRRICKGCGTILIPGDTCRVRIRHNRSRHVVVTCTECGHIKRYYAS